MKLSALAAAANTSRPNHSILVYGHAKTGKTRLVGTAAKIPELKRIVWFDLENGAETLLNMGLTPEEMDKIELIRIPDTREVPRAAETILKCFSAKTPLQICEVHGRVGCVECTKESLPSTTWDFKSLTHNDLVVIDSGSQLSDSCLALACVGKPVEFKPGFDEWGSMGKYLGDILSVIQAAQHTNFVVITHTQIIEEDINNVKTDKIVPLMGTRAFCQKVAKYFGTVAYLELKLGKHAAGSKSTYKTNHVTGSRLNIAIENSKEASMRDILIEGGILK
jgi:hypothetical protein